MYIEILNKCMHFYYKYVLFETNGGQIKAEIDG